MFILSLMSDLVRVLPEQFNLDNVTAITHQLNGKYANKIIAHLGLCVAVYDVLEVDEGQLRPGDGSSYINVRFRALIFKPFIGEIVTGWITKCTVDGIKVSLSGMFEDIFIPKNMLFEGCHFSVNENAWVWPMDEDTELYFDINEKIRFRVEQEVFIDVKPKSPKERDQEEKAKENGELETTEKLPSYAILGSCQTDGMGLVSWWE
ncbi:hypothetical protein TPHA_0N01030 [Tetrapisispora phaffii CBS 4417]|uniref:DNA-directed RNA polymerase subunit n=1 Tax=Tetrapisispora phaffii (strain ATCC 24235 / CBS 4417 / NBRC 1672 / NRRL Y-8282 / UCD 70-5) TaxID=1071381 RepID=G8C156_TETPH|nr:hypothetical protein TPHA_0N01030 [Tetrapisispora phaffii CBS 4417]CCE65884.1 hypothetical protein TPHA_0N01030 [Tetrapisispora phaffii CBS 4417]